MKKQSHTPEALGILNDEALAGVGASTLMRTLGPVLQSRLDYVLTALEQAKPDLNELLDLRAKLCVLRQIERELQTQMQRGHEAAESIEQQYRN